MIYLFIALWIVCGVAAYLIERWSCKRKGYGWTIKDRREAILAAVLLAPLDLIITLIFCWIHWSDKPSKW